MNSKKQILLLGLFLFIQAFALSLTSFGATIVTIDNNGGKVTVDNVKEWSNCVAKGTQLIDMAHDRSFITFDVQALAAGYYTFSSTIATSMNDIGCALGYTNASGSFIDADTLAITNTGSWTSTKTYKWNFYLKADTTYAFKMMCFTSSGYALNLFAINIASFVADVAINNVAVNGFAVIPINNEYTTTANFDQDIAVAVTPHSNTGELSYSAKCNNQDISISNVGLITKSQFKNGDIIKVFVKIIDGPVTSDEYLITINVNNNLKKQIRGTTINDGVWTGINNSSSIQSWTDYIYTLTPQETDTRFSNGSYSFNGSTHYGFYANNAHVKINFPSYFAIKNITLIGYGAATFGLSSEGSTVNTSVKNAFDAASTSSQPDEVQFVLNGHIPGKPLDLTVSDTYCRFYIIINYEKTDDVTAPYLLTQNINENETVGSSNGLISLRFSEPINLSGSTPATLDGQDVKLKLENNVFANYYFWELDYNSEHTFVLKANSLVDLAGNKNANDITIHFSIAKKPELTKKTYDFIVGIDGTIDQAFAAANKASGKNRYYIFVPNGSYELTGNESDHMTSLNRSNVSIIGQSKDGAIIFNTPVSYGISSTATIHLKSASNTYMQDITIKNSRGESDQGQQVALYDRSSKNTFKNVKLYSFQDTYVTGDRSYHENCEIYGSTDYVCGGGNAFFENCLFYNRASSGNKVTAPATSLDQKWGYVFSNCTINGGAFVLGRPWQGEPKAYYLYTKMNIQPDGTGWEGMGGLVTHFYEYKSMDYSGNLLDLSKRGNSPTSTNSYVPVLTDEQALEFNLYNVVGGTDGYLPTDFTKQTRAPEITVSGNRLSWENNPDALCTVIIKEGKYHSCTSENYVELSENGTYTLQAANEMGGLGEATTLEVTTTGVKSIRENNHSTPSGIYDFMGRKLQKEPQHGFYIMDGKKYFRN